METTPEIPVSLFLQAVRRRPEVWSTAQGQADDKRRVASAWKEICRNTWIQFDSWTVEQKRTRCLILQKKWQTLQKDFMNSQGKVNSAKTAHHNLLTFLVADKKPSRSEEDEDPRQAKRARSEECVSEDRHFLLSLESYLHDVPRSSKLALREDMLRLVRKYTPASHHHTSVTSGTHSQEY